MRVGNYRLGIDLGTNSLGWALIRLDDDDTPQGIIRLGSRIFSDGRNPKDGQSLAVMRRVPRQQRRRRDRFLKRQSRLMQQLISMGLMPADEQSRKDLERLDPYELRARGITESLTPSELGRAIFHLNQRRGFKSNRRTDKSEANEKGKIASAVARVQAELDEQGFPTLGVYLHARRQQGKTVRARLNGEGAKASYELYLHRDMVAQEFDLLWARQASYAPTALTPEYGQMLRDTLLFQRPLKPVRPGKCSFNSTEDRLPQAHPLVQRLRILQDLNHLRYTSPGQSAQALTLEQRNAVFEKLLRQKTMGFPAIKKAAGIPANSLVNLESERRDKLLGDATAGVLAKPEFFGDAWYGFSVDTQVELVSLLQNEEDERAVVERLIKMGVAPEQAAHISDKAVLPPGYGRLGSSAARSIVEQLLNKVTSYAEAVIAAGYTEHYQASDEVLESLPYYGSVLASQVGGGSGDPRDKNEELIHGKIANPTVHIGLNQLRKVINEIIGKYGHPRQIAIELARELKLSRDKKIERDRQYAQNQKANDEYRKDIEKAGFAVTHDSMLRMRLWHEMSRNPLERCCVYTGEHISIHRLLSNDGGVHIDHVLPFSRTLDDSAGNKVLCMRQANSFKRNMTPHEAFAHAPAGYDWEAILARAQGLPYSKRKKFAADAMQRYNTEERDFLARQLTDTAYLARVSRQYLECICPRNKIWSNPGQLTALLRNKWGLNRQLSENGVKNRDDHRHHAVDALVIALIDRSLLQKVAAASARADREGQNNLIDRMPEPWSNFHLTVTNAVSHIVVSHKPDHGPEAALHNDTAYGLVGTDAKGVSTVRHRVPLDGFDKREKLNAIVDQNLRADIERAINGSADGKAMKAALAAFSGSTGVRRVRIEERLRVIPIKNREGDIYKAYKGDGNYCYEIFRLPNGRWDGEIISSFEANQNVYRDFRKNKKRFRLDGFSGKPLVMRICRDDILAVNDTGGRRIMRVAMLSDGIITLAEHMEGGNLRERDRSKDDDFKYMYKSPNALQKLNARAAIITPLGFVYDPGFKP